VNFSEIIIPFPSIPEQEVIVNRISKFMNIVDELEKKINKRKEQTTQLIHSVLRETFEQK
jgi:restriction endonuclease S subunit